MRRLRRGSQPRPGRPRSPSAPTTWSRLQWLDVVRCGSKAAGAAGSAGEQPAFRARKHGPGVKNRRRWSAVGRVRFRHCSPTMPVTHAARAERASHAFRQRCGYFDGASDGAPLPRYEGGRKRNDDAPASLNTGRYRLGCLTIESERTRRCRELFSLSPCGRGCRAADKRRGG